VPKRAEGDGNAELISTPASPNRPDGEPVEASRTLNARIGRPALGAKPEEICSGWVLLSLWRVSDAGPMNDGAAQAEGRRLTGRDMLSLRLVAVDLSWGHCRRWL